MPFIMLRKLLYAPSFLGNFIMKGFLDFEKCFFLCQLGWLCISFLHSSNVVYYLTDFPMKHLAFLR